jgi:hopanoid C-3 methylase
MKILLINPPRSPENKILEYAKPEALPYIHKKLIGPPLGLLTIAAALKDDHDVTFFEMKGEYDLCPAAPDYKELALEYLKKTNPDIVGVTFIASEFNYGIEIFKTVKKFNPNILTVAGGLHTTLCPEDFSDASVDIVCPGQSANIFKKIARVKEKNEKLSDIKGIFINGNEGLTFTGASDESWDPAGKDFIMPDRSFIKKWIESYRVHTHDFISTYLFTSLGCPYKCTFCSIWPQFGGHFYQRDVESIIAELKNLDPEYKVVRFADANTVVNEDFINRLCNRILEEKIDKKYVMDIRFDTVVNYPHLIEKLAKIGLIVVICGFESFREEELKKYNKSSSASLIEKAIDILHGNGINLRGNYIVPCDYDEDDFKALSDYAGSHRVVYAGYTIVTPMPGTVFYNEVKNEIVDRDLSKYNFFNAILKTKLPIEKFYEKVSDLWLIKKGKDYL